LDLNQDGIGDAEESDLAQKIATLLAQTSVTQGNTTQTDSDGD